MRDPDCFLKTHLEDKSLNTKLTSRLSQNQVSSNAQKVGMTIGAAIRQQSRSRSRLHFSKKTDEAKKLYHC